MRTMAYGKLFCIGKGELLLKGTKYEANKNYCANKMLLLNIFLAQQNYIKITCECLVHECYFGLSAEPIVPLLYVST